MQKILYLGLDPSRYVHHGELTHFPLISTQPRPFAGDIQKTFCILSSFPSILFTSRTAIPLYVAYAEKAGYGLKEIQEKKYLCVGQGTAKRLQDFKLTPTYIAQEETAEGVISLIQKFKITGPFFFPRSAQGRSLLPNFLTSLEAQVVDLYDTIFLKHPLPNLEEFDQIVFTSPSTVDAFLTLAHTLPPIEKCISMGPITANYLNSLIN